MPTTRHRCLLTTLIASISLLGGCALFSGDDTSHPEGTWNCSAHWNYEREGVALPVSVSMDNLCLKNVLSAKGQIAIGDAKWTESKQGSCYASGDELYGKWTSSKTTPENDAARAFERDQLAGKPLAAVGMEQEQAYRVRVTSRTDTMFKFVNADGRDVTCKRL